MRRLSEQELLRHPVHTLTEAREPSSEQLVWDVLSTFMRDDLALDARQQSELLRRFSRALAARRGAP
jgi:hypothetical protein